MTDPAPAARPPWKLWHLSAAVAAVAAALAVGIRVPEVGLPLASWGAFLAPLYLASACCERVTRRFLAEGKRPDPFVEIGLNRIFFFVILAVPYVAVVPMVLAWLMSLRGG